jgi:hypothetical protein
VLVLARAPALSYAHHLSGRVEIKALVSRSQLAVHSNPRIKLSVLQGWPVPPEGELLS